MSRDEGVLKFECRLRQAAPPDAVLVEELVAYRNKLFDMELIGVYPDGIGFGNISQRCRSAAGDTRVRFFISASQTGHIRCATIADFVAVDDYSIENNWVACSGTQRASSESLTHAMIYEAFPTALAVIHVHNQVAWQSLKGILPTTPADVAYGTPAMALAVKQLAEQDQLTDRSVFVMAGHEDGIIAFGPNLKQAFFNLRQELNIS